MWVCVELRIGQTVWFLVVYFMVQQCKHWTTILSAWTKFSDISIFSLIWFCKRLIVSTEQDINQSTYRKWFFFFLNIEPCEKWSTEKNTWSNVPRAIKMFLCWKIHVDQMFFFFATYKCIAQLRVMWKCCWLELNWIWFCKIATLNEIISIVICR